MKRVSTLVALLILGAAPVALAGGAQGGHSRDGDVTAVRLVPATGSADVVIAVRGALELRDFPLREPVRVVVDLVGARLSGPVTLYDGRSRGGVRNVRYAQFRPDIVRVVIELDALSRYEVQRTDAEVRIRLLTERTDFAAWSSEDRGAAPARAEPAVTVAPARGGLAQAAVSAPSADAIAGYLAAHAAEAQGSQQPRITVTWDSASIAEVVQGFATFSGRSIILGRDVKGFVTAEIRNQPWDFAMSAVLESQGLAAEELAGGIIRVADKSILARADSTEPLRTAVIRLNYARATGMATTLSAIVTKGRGSVTADTATNALIITDIVSRLSDDTAFARSLDIRTPQVSIQAKIIFVDRTNVEELGVRYDIGSETQFFNRLVTRPDPRTAQPVDTDLDGVPDALVPTENFDRNVNIIDLGGNSLALIGNANAQTVRLSALSLIFSTAMGNFSLTSFLEALQQVQLSDVQAEPLIATLDNQPARIQVGDRVPIRVVDVASAATGTGAVAQASVQFEETGIILEVTPHVTANRQVLMRIMAERSTVLPGPVDIGFTIQKQVATNQLLVADGETVVIGGLTVTEVKVAKSGIPFLVDLPLIGRLFGFSSQEETRRDLLILITPHIIDDPTGAPQGSSD